MPKSKQGKLRLKELEEECMELIVDSGARLDMSDTGVHYELSSKFHSEVFFNMPRVFELAPRRERMARLFLMKMKEAEVPLGDIDILLGPAPTAIPFMCELQHFVEMQHTRLVFVEREVPKKFILRRGFKIAPEEKIFIVDDAGTTYETMRECIKIAQGKDGEVTNDDRGGTVVGCGVLIDRSVDGKRVWRQTPLG
jgi:orotate phosphoribosyltransferase